MRPFFRYYGSKWIGAKHYGPPRRGEVIEPFAGSACYSVYWDCPNVSLYDLSEDACIVWDWLIHCSEEDVRRIPATFRTDEELAELPDGARQVASSFLWYGECAFRPAVPEFVKRWARTGEYTGFAATNRDKGESDDTIFRWGESRKERIIRQKPLIRDWTIERLSYDRIPLREAHWHVDPPYQGKAGRKYPHNEIDFGHLAEWCRSLPGAADVCEQEGADWLPFEDLYQGTTCEGRDGKRTASREVLWRSDPEPDLFAEDGHA